MQPLSPGKPLRDVLAPDLDVLFVGISPAVLGRQPERVGGAETWVAPDPSGLNAHHQLPDLARAYGELRVPPDPRG